MQNNINPSTASEIIKMICVNTYYMDKHCSAENEIYCPLCGENMYVKDDDDSTVKCDSETCGHEIDMTEDHDSDYDYEDYNF